MINKGLFFLLLSCYLLPFPVLAKKAVHILIVADMNEEPYKETISGFKKQISAYTQVEFTELSLSQAKPAHNEIKNINPDFIYSLGNEATQWASFQTTRIPIIGTMVFNDSVYNQATNITGVSLNYTLKTQFSWLKRFFPLKKQATILFNPQENQTTFDMARKIGHQYGFKLVGIPVKTRKDLPDALKQLDNKTEILFEIPDKTAMSVNTAKEVLLASFRNKIPIVGLSDNWVRSGAVYALSWDFNDIGKQSADLVYRILNGKPIQNIPPEHPRKVTYTINTKIAEHMHIKIPKDIVKNAKMIFN